MEGYVMSFTKQALFLVLILSAIPVMLALVVGLLVSLFQATTQIQEQTLTFVPKLVAVVLGLAFAGPWMMTQLIQFSKGLLEIFPTIIKG